MIFILWAIFFLFHSNDTNGLVGSHIYVYGALRLFFAILAYYYRVVGKYPLETRASCSYSLEFLKGLNSTGSWILSTKAACELVCFSIWDPVI
jgi:hypothetical protein